MESSNDSSVPTWSGENLLKEPLDEWLFFLSFYFKVNANKYKQDQAKVLFTSLKLCGTARTWFMNFFQDYEEKNDTVLTFELLEKEMKNRFENKVDPMILIAKFLKLKQGKTQSITSFNNLFSKKLDEIKITDERIGIVVYLEGLKTEIQKQFLNIVEKPEKLEDYFSLALRIEHLQNQSVGKTNWKELCKYGAQCKFKDTTCNHFHPKSNKDEMKQLKCEHCGKDGHKMEKCWTKYPDQRPKNGKEILN